MYSVQSTLQLRSTIKPHGQDKNSSNQFQVIQLKLQHTQLHLLGSLLSSVVTRLNPYISGHRKSCCCTCSRHVIRPCSHCMRFHCDEYPISMCTDFRSLSTLWSSSILLHKIRDWYALRHCQTWAMLPFLALLMLRNDRKRQGIEEKVGKAVTWVQSIGFNSDPINIGWIPIAVDSAASVKAWNSHSVRKKLECQCEHDVRWAVEVHKEINRHSKVKTVPRVPCMQKCPNPVLCNGVVEDTHSVATVHPKQVWLVATSGVCKVRCTYAYVIWIQYNRNIKRMFSIPYLHAHMY